MASSWGFLKGVSSSQVTPPPSVWCPQTGSGHSVNTPDASCQDLVVSQATRGTTGHRASSCS